MQPTTAEVTRAASHDPHPVPAPKWKAWLPAFIWLGIIAAESTRVFSAANTGQWLYPIFHYFTGVDRARFEIWNGILRKLGHFVGYFVLSVLLFRAWRATLPSRATAWSQRWAGIAWLMTTTVAGLDEWHQTYIPSRTGTIRDVILDSAAALIAQFVIWAFLIRKTV